MLEKIEKTIQKLFLLLAGTFMIIAVILAIAQVMFRYVLKISVPWTEELVRALYIYIVYFGAVLLESEDGQIRTTMLTDRFHPAFGNIWKVVMALFSILFNIIVLIGSFGAYGETMSVLGSIPWISSNILYIPIFIATPFMVFYQIMYMLRALGVKVPLSQAKEVSES